MAQSLPPALEQELQKFETMRRNHETLSMMVQTMQQELNEAKATLEALRDQPDDVITYKTVGQMMFRVEKPKVVEDLEDREKMLGMKIASTNKQVETLAGKLQELQTKLQMELSKQNLRLS